MKVLFAMPEENLFAVLSIFKAIKMYICAQPESLQNGWKFYGHRTILISRAGYKVACSYNKGSCFPPQLRFKVISETHIHFTENRNFSKLVKNYTSRSNYKIGGFPDVLHHAGHI